MSQNAPAEKKILRPNPVKSTIYKSTFFNLKGDRRSNFTFCHLFDPTDEAFGAYTRDFDILTSLYIEKYRLIDGIDKAHYDHYKSLANRHTDMSLRSVAEFVGCGPHRSGRSLDRLQDVGLIHRVCRLDTKGAAHDVVVHTPFARPPNPDWTAETAEREPRFLRQISALDLEWMRERINYGPPDKYTKKPMGYTKAMRFERREDETEGGRKRDTCCSDGLRYDPRLVRMAVNGLEFTEGATKIPRRYSKADALTDKFTSLVLDALKRIHMLGHVPQPFESNTAARTHNWEVFKEFLQGFCERAGITLNSPRYKAAWALGSYYAPNVFHYVEI
jgi:hypothetical protein